MIYLSKSIYLLFGITLLGFAGLQFNDPDPFIWVSFYLVCALIPLLLLADKFYRPLFGAAMFICLVEIINSAPGAYQYYLHMAEEPLMQGMNPQKPYIEECREFLGAAIALALVLLSGILTKAKPTR